MGWDPNNALVLATAAMTVLAGVVFALGWAKVRTGRVEPGAATDELGEETPALVDLLTGGFVVGDDAVAATLVDLAARRHLAIENVGAGNLVLRVRRAGRPDDPLERYEQRVLDRVRALAGTDGLMPAAALTTGPEGLSTRWWKGFVREVTAHGRARGLCTRRWTLRALAPVWMTLAPAATLAWLTLDTAGRSEDADWLSPLNVLAVLSIAACAAMVLAALKATRGDAQRATPTGTERAAAWLGVRRWMEAADYEHKTADHVVLWDRLLAYATAMDLTPLILGQFPFAGEHDKRAWSNTGGTWRRVDIRYWSLRPSWGDSPGRAIGLGVGRTVVWGVFFAVGVAMAVADLDGVPDDAVTPVRVGGLVLASITLVGVARALWRLVLGVADLFGRAEIEGTVLRHRRLEEGHRLPAIIRWFAYARDREQHRLRRHEYWAAVDDGSDDSITAFRMDQRRFGRMGQGDRVRLEITPRLGHVRSVEVLEAGERLRVTGVTHELEAEAIDAVAGRAQGFGETLAERFRTIGTMTDADGKPLIDLTEERDGVTLGEQLAEAKKTLDGLGAVADHRRTRADGNSLLGGILGAVNEALDGLSDAGRPDAEVPEGTSDDAPQDRPNRLGEP